MKNCFNCGQILGDEANICFKCGAVQSQEGKAKKEVVDGEIHICPGCGKPIKSSFITVCECGYELRGIDGSGKIKDFSNELGRKSTVEAKVQFIRNFIIPNTKEDIFEFASQATRNIKNYDRNGDNAFDKDEISLVNAWRLLLEQCMNRAAKLYKQTSSDYQEIVTMYKEAEESYLFAKVKQEKKDNKKKAQDGFTKIFSKKLIIAIISCVLAVIIGFSFFISITSEDSRIKKDIENAELLIKNGNYEEAYLTLTTMESTYKFLIKKQGDTISKLIYDAETQRLNELVEECEKAILSEEYSRAKEMLKLFESLSGNKKTEYLAEKTRLSEELLYHETGIKTITMTISSSDLIGKKCSVVRSILIDTLGFKSENITVYAHDQSEDETNVYTITIDGQSTFKVGTKFTDSAKIYIDCERKIVIGKSNKDFKNEDCNEMVAYLKGLGFTNIVLDASAGILFSEGHIKSITINGEEKFDKDSLFLSTAEIVIVYRRYK